MSEPLVSVVLPAYNVANYLDECLETIVSQTYRRLEIIIVDDGSTDKTSEKADEWAARDRRVVTIHQENGGLSDARNTGISQARGEFVLLVDPDDRIDGNLISLCVARIDGQVDLVHFGYKTISEEGHALRRFSDMGADGDLLSSIFSGKISSHSWQLLCRRSLYTGVLFPKGRKSEDAATTYRLVSRARQYVILPDCPYEYRVRSGSILSELASDRAKAVRYYEDELLSFHEMIEWTILQKREDYTVLVRNNLIRHLFRHYRSSVGSGNFLGVTWTSARLRDELAEFGMSDLDSLNKFEALLFRFGLSDTFYRVYNRMKCIAKRLLQRPT